MTNRLLAKSRTATRCKELLVHCLAALRHGMDGCSGAGSTASSH